MTTAAAGQAEAAVEQAPFVTLSDAPATREPEAAPTPESAESEPVEASEADDKTPLDDIEYDENDPAQKAAYEALRKKMLPKWQARVESLKKPKEGETQPQAPAEQPAPQEAAQGEWDPYTVPLSDFTYVGDPEPEDSGIHGFEKEIDRRIQEGVKKAIEFTLGQMRVNDGRLREQQQVGTAREVISKYAEALMAHPDYSEKAAELAEFAANTKELAVRNPEKWVSLAETLSGIPRNWRDTEPETPREQPRKPTANKAHAIVERPTRPAMTPTPSAGNMTLQAALDKALKARRG
jgi:hypothetical protein